MKAIRTYGAFNFRRYGNPWVAKVVNMKPDFSDKIGGYTGRYNAGEAGELYVSDPVEGQVYVYGQKDHRGGNTSMEYVVFLNGDFREITKTELSKYF